MKQKQHSALFVTLVRCIAPVLAIVSGVAQANSIDFSKLSNKQVREALEVKIRTIRHMALNPVVIDAVKDQNNQNVEAITIKRRGVAWKKSAVTNALKQEIDRKDASHFLKRRVTGSTEFTRALLTDNRGANVANYPSAHSYTHSKTESWTASWNNGSGNVYLSRPLLDKRQGTHSVQISAPVQDRGVTIGVLMVDVAIENYAVQTGTAPSVTKKKVEKSAESKVTKSKAVDSKKKDMEQAARSEKVQVEEFPVEAMQVPETDSKEAEPTGSGSVEVGSTEAELIETVSGKVDPNNIASDTTE